MATEVPSCEGRASAATSRTAGRTLGGAAHHDALLFFRSREYLPLGNDSTHSMCTTCAPAILLTADMIDWCACEAAYSNQSFGRRLCRQSHVQCAQHSHGYTLGRLTVLHPARGEGPSPSHSHCRNTCADSVCGMCIYVDSCLIGCGLCSCTFFHTGKLELCLATQSESACLLTYFACTHTHTYCK